MTQDKFSTIVNPMLELVRKYPGIVDVRGYTDNEKNDAIIDVVLTDTDTLTKLLNAFGYGSCSWRTSVLGTDTPSHLHFYARTPLGEFNASTFKIEIDYKICLLKV